MIFLIDNLKWRKNENIFFSCEFQISCMCVAFVVMHFVDETEDETYFSATEIWITILYILCVIMMMFCSFMCNRKSNFCIRCNISKNSLMCEMKESVGEEVESFFLGIMDKRKERMNKWKNHNEKWQMKIRFFFGKEFL